MHQRRGLVLLALYEAAEPKLVDQLVDAGGVAQRCLGTIRAEALRG